MKTGSSRLFICKENLPKKVILKLSVLYEKLSKKCREGCMNEEKRLFGWSKEAL